MFLKPKQPSMLLKQESPRTFGKSSFFSSGRYAYLSDEPPSSQGNAGYARQRSVSAKRKLGDQLSYAAAAGGIVRPEENNAILDSLNTNVAKVGSLCDKISTEIEATDASPEIMSILTDLCEAVKLINSNQNSLVSLKSVSKVSLSAPPKRIRQAATSSSANTSSQVAGTQPASSSATITVSDEEEDPALSKFKEAVNDSEKSTLIFNLNMGKVPIMNKDTMSKKATMSLLAMAAKTEGKETTTPSDDAIAAIDDVLSMADGMQFFGNSTKTYRGNNDPESGSYCTVPVRYDFKDKDTRFRAEQVLRETCKIKCSTPYPTILRECIKKVITHVKSDFPNDFIRVLVDANNMALKVARRPKDCAEWTYYKRDIGLPAAVLNVNTRKVPEELLLTNLPGSGEDNITPTKPFRGRNQTKKLTVNSIQPMSERSGSEYY